MLFVRTRENDGGERRGAAAAAMKKKCYLSEHMRMRGKQNMTIMRPYSHWSNSWQSCPHPCLCRSGTPGTCTSPPNTRMSVFYSWFSLEFNSNLHAHNYDTLSSFIFMQIFNNVLSQHAYDFVPKGVHARGYALQLKIKHCWKLFLFEMLCCVLARMNEYIVQIIPATRLWLISRYSHHTLKKRQKMTAKNRHPCTEWFSSLCLQANHKHMEKQSLFCTRKTSFYMDNITSTLTIVVFSINWSQMFALYVRQMCCKLELKTLNNWKTTASLRNHQKRCVCSDPCICTTQRYSFFSAMFCTKYEEYFPNHLILL